MKKKYILGSDQFSGLSKAMQKLMILLFFVVFSVLNAQGQVTVAGAVSGNGDYTTLTDAFNAIGTVQTGANITVTIRGNTTETGTVLINAGDWSSIVISPSGGSWTITGNIPGADLIRFNGADNVVIDGLNSGGNGLTFSNTSTSNTSGTSTIKYMADATSNTIRNCNLLGSATVGLGAMGGVVFFTNTATITGNDNNTISNCNIGPAGTNLPSKLIFASGSSTVSLYNSGNTITGCNLYDYFATTGAAAVYITSGNTDCTVTNNKIYQSAPRNFTSAATFYGIYFGNPTNSNNIHIDGNIIGYANNSGTGTLTLTSNAGINGAFIGIYYFGSTTAPDVCSINNNTVANISLTSAAGSLQGIYNTTGASSNSININGNTVRNLTAVNTTNSLVGIYAGAATTLDCSNNTVSNLSRNAAGHFYGIIYATATNATFDSNTITNLSTTAADNGTSNFAGIFSISTPQTEKFFNNTITGLTSASTTSGIKFFGINNGTNATGNKIFIGNKISELSLPSTATGTIYGIKLNGGGTQNNILGNTIHTISGGNGIIGIAITAGTTNDVSKNKIYGLSSPSAGAVMYGMSLTGGTTHNVYNNILGNLTAPAGDNAAGTPNQVIGVNASGLTNLNLYHNTIKIEALSTGANFGTSAVNVDAGTTLTMRNNILVNTSAANGTGLSAVLRKPTLTAYDVSSNNNLFYGTAVYTDGANTDMTLTAFRTRLVNRDGLSLNENPNFTSTTGSDATYLHINTALPTQIDNGGANIASVTDDFDGNARNATTPDIGADEFTSAAAPCGTALGGNSAPAMATFCSSGNTTISATGYTTANGITYQWESSSDAAFTTPVSVGTASATYANLTTPVITATTYYRLKVTCSAGTPSYSSVSTVTVNTTAAPTGSANQNLTNTQTVGEIIVNGTGIVWYASAADAANGVNPISPSTPVNNAVYYATQTIGGCTSATSLAVTVTIVLGNGEFRSNEFKYYPNPVNDILNVESDNAISSIEVYNVTGQKVGQKTINETHAAFDMSGLSAGAYLVKVIADEEVETIKIIRK